MVKVLNTSPITSDQAYYQLIDDLMKLNLTRNEARAYLALLPFESAPASKLIEKTGIADSKIYRIMDNLQKKGLITIQEGVPKLFIAIHPYEAMENQRTILKTEFLNKMTSIDKLVELLTPIYQDHEESPKLAYILKGENNILNHTRRLIDEAMSSVILMMPNEEVYYSLENSITLAQERGSDVSLGFYRRKLPSNSIPFNFQVIHCNCFFLIIDNKTLLTISNWNTNHWHAIWTTDTSLIEVSQGYFSSPACCASEDSKAYQ
ncbi:MAG: TrmB family transcriptional regulator [Promethearchaeota archaeon]